ncbi:hypothetical protein Patl1_03900 [Pistacia atlantica]|uniref:Uncharacterized protein n=1 Tax=Pistacia atlantica TaxID=434234 RepID=A0ACC1BTM4_9ROSI|nr:hypothetical protein Patl1_03900 [Pistacia atlantica]
MANCENAPLFETRRAKGRVLYRLFAASVFVGICFIWAYRVNHLPSDQENGRWVWFGLFAAELWFGIYWLLTQALRWNRVYRHTFKDRLSQRYENELPGVDIFVCTADPKLEPPMMVINTVLSVMASHFSKHWISFCKKFKVEPRSPAAYFASLSDSHTASPSKDLTAIKKLYEDMENRIQTATKLGRITKEIGMKHKGFSQWDSYLSPVDHDSILQILIDGRDPEAVDIEGYPLPTLVYLAREKRPQHFHNYKAGAMNALIRVSSEISNGQIILNVDCDMYSNYSQSVRDALCFFMDEEKGHEIAYVQFPQNFENITKNEVYSNSLRVISEVEFHGLDGYGGPLYVGTGCFHRRETLCGRKFSKENKIELKRDNDAKRQESVLELEENLKALASCTYEINTKWGSEIGVQYGCPVEDVITGLTIQCRGWKSVYYNPERKAFLGVAPTTLPQTLLQHKRWSEGDFQILLSKYSPACIILLHFSFTLSSQRDLLVSTAWWNFCGLVAQSLAWWNDQRIWLYKRTSSYLFAFIDTILKSLGFSESAFVVTAKVADEDVSQRYEKEIMEFGASSSMFTILATLALLNLFCLIGVLKKVILDQGIFRLYDTMLLQVLLCGVLVLINLPMYQGLFLRKDNGKMPSSLTAKSLVLALSAFYRVTHIPREGEDGRWAWIGLFGAELWFSLYWVCTQALRWNCVYRCTFPDRLSQRSLPLSLSLSLSMNYEPPMMVINTVLSVMAFDYPPEKLSVYLSDDAGSDLTFYALLEASHFTKHWIPYCKKFNVEPRSPGSYFLSISYHYDLKEASEFLAIKKLYEDMEKQIRKAAKLGRLAEEIRSNHHEFSQWDSYSLRCDHDTILQVLIDRRDPDAIDVEGCSLPNLVYLAREKRPQHPHNFKAGAMNALLRVSQKISNGQIILNVDCDMYSNNSNSVRDALCFFMDEKKGNDIAFVQFPQNFENVTKNEIYSGSFRVGMEVEFHGMDGYGGPPYIGTGCFHRREILRGRNFDSGYKGEWQREDSLHALEDKLKAFATCEYEENTEWGKEMGLKYGCPVEDVITGLSIQCKGWKSVYYNPERKAFLGVSTTTLPQTLLQHKRWSEGDFLILISKFSPAWYAHGKISLGLQLGYCCYCLWAPTCLAALYYSTIPSLCILRGIFLFPQFSSPWFVPFAYVISAKYTDSLVEFLWSLGFSDPAFEITAKVADEDVMERYNKEIMEFGASSPMFTLLATLALLNLFCFGGVVKKVAMEDGAIRFDRMVLQILLCGVLILINWPLYQGLFFRKDKGKMPSSTTVKSIGLALFACTWSVFFMKFGALKFCVAVLLALVLSPQGVFGIRFVIDREECFSYNVQYEGDTVHTSFVVIKSDKYWYGGTEGVDLVVKGPTGDQVHDFRGKISEKFDFVAHHKGVYRFCFTNQSPYHETVDFDVHVGHFSYFDEHAKDEHFNPLLDQISKLEEALYNIQFEQHWLEAQTERQAILNEAMGKRAVYKAFWESAALIGASVLQVYLLRRLFERKLGMSRV